VPSIPFPLNLVPNCISMMPDIMNFILNVPGQLTNVAYGTLKKAYGKITSMQVPTIPDSIKKPEGLQTCPKHENKDEKKDGGDAGESSSGSSDVTQDMIDNGEAFGETSV